MKGIIGILMIVGGIWLFIKYAGPSERDMRTVHVIDKFNSQKDQMRAEAEKSSLKFGAYRELWVRLTMARDCPKVQL
jgi:hypothetical protein